VGVAVGAGARGSGIGNAGPVRLEVWVPPVGGAPSRHTGTGGAADGVHEQRLRDSGAGSRVVPRRKQLCKQPDEAMSSSRGDARAAERARKGGANMAL
jgi:hypothetical protein